MVSVNWSFSSVNKVIYCIFIKSMNFSFVKKKKKQQTKPNINPNEIFAHNLFVFLSFINELSTRVSIKFLVQIRNAFSKPNLPVFPSYHALFFLLIYTLIVCFRITRLRL